MYTLWIKWTGKVQVPWDTSFPQGLQRDDSGHSCLNATLVDLTFGVPGLNGHSTGNTAEENVKANLRLLCNSLVTVKAGI